MSGYAGERGGFRYWSQPSLYKIAVCPLSNFEMVVDKRHESYLQASTFPRSPVGFLSIHVKPVLLCGHEAQGVGNRDSWSCHENLAADSDACRTVSNAYFVLAEAFIQTPHEW